MTDIDTQRWGDSQVLQVTTTAGENALAVSKQLLQAHWQRPLLWKVLTVIRPDIPAGENVTFIVTVTLNIGVGQASIQAPFTYTFAPVGGVYAPQVIFQDIPAQDIQGQVSVAVSGGGSPTVPAGDAFYVALLAAPFTEPRAVTDMRDLFLASLPPRGDALADNSQGGMRWMPPGFDDGEVRYRR